MFSFWICFSFVATVAISGGVLLLALVNENRRFWKVHHQRPTPIEHAVARVNLIVPCKGVGPESKDNLQSFFFQDHPNFRITFVVENRRDPAFSLIEELRSEHHYVETSVVCAGVASVGGQKIHNLLAAVGNLQKSIDILAFADMDISVGPSWLRWLTSGVGREDVGARTGYRWMIPADRKAATLFGVTLNNAIASLLGRNSRALVWGGSWAVHRQIFEGVGIAQAWKGVLSDDLAVSRAFRLAGLGIEFEPRCLCPTVVRFSWSGLVEFLSRQLKIIRLYAPAYWLGGFVFLAFTQLAIWGSLVGACIYATGGILNSPGTIMLLVAFAVSGLMLARAALRQNMARRSISGWRAHKDARHMDLFAGPMVGAFCVYAWIRSAFGKRVTWSNVHYGVAENGSTRVLARNVNRKKWPINLRPHIGKKPAGQTRKMEARANQN